MRYQNPLYALVSQRPGSPTGRSQPAADTEKGVCVKTAAAHNECSQCHKLGEEVKRLIQEKQELLVDLINTNQAFMRLQHDHAALLQKTTGIKQQQGSDATPATDSSKDSEQQAVPISSDLLVKPSQALPAVAAITAVADVDGTDTPTLEPSSPAAVVIKRKRARWDKTGPLRSSLKQPLKSISSLMSTRHSTATTITTTTIGTSVLAAAAISNSPKATPTRSPKALSKLRASFQLLTNSSSNSIIGNGSAGAAGSGSNTAAAGAASVGVSSLASNSSPIIDVAALTQLQHGCTPISTGLQQTTPRISTGNIISSSNKAAGRRSVDYSGAVAFGKSSGSSSGNKFGLGISSLGRMTGRHSIDSSASTSASSTSIRTSINTLPSAIMSGLSVRTRRSGSFLPGSFCKSPKATAAVQLQNDTAGSPTTTTTTTTTTAAAEAAAVEVDDLPQSTAATVQPSSADDSGAKGQAAGATNQASIKQPNNGGSSSSKRLSGGGSGGSSSSSAPVRSRKPSHLRPLSPKSRALKDLASPTTPGAATPRDADIQDAPAADATVSEPAAVVAPVAPAEPSSSAAAAVAQLLQPLAGSAFAASKVKFLKPRKHGSSSSSSANKRATAACSSSDATTAGLPSALGGVTAAPVSEPSSPKPYFGRVWDKWHAKVWQSAAAAEQGQPGALPSNNSNSTGTVEGAAAILALLAASNDAAAAADGGSAAAGSSSTTRKAVDMLIAWPLEFGAELEYECGASSRPSIV